MSPGSASTLASNAAPATSRAYVPTWSSVGLNANAPVYGIVPRVGLKPAMPQKAAGRIIEPLVCVPIAASTWPAATAAADPDDEPPGVCRAFHGLRVLPGWKYANSVVTVLPNT